MLLRKFPAPIPSTGLSLNERHAARQTSTRPEPRLPETPCSWKIVAARSRNGDAPASITTTAAAASASAYVTSATRAGRTGRREQERHETTLASASSPLRESEATTESTIAATTP